MLPTQSTETRNEKQDWMPANLKKELGHFNVCRLSEVLGKPHGPMPYRRIDYYKISLMLGNNRLEYADKVLEINSPSLVFSNPLIPYKWERLSENPTGYFCIFTEAFFRQFGHLRDYPLYQPGNIPVFTLSDEQSATVTALYERMLAEIRSDYAFKYDVIRTLVFELIHLALKMQPANTSIYANSNASVRISSLFMELLERQFPIESPSHQIALRSPSEYASQMAIHVNHLNRALREVSGKTTTKLIAERIIQEAKSLLRHTTWNIGEVAWCLGFEERSHFINFFKKNTRLSPGTYRENQ
ncbi:helix-turn-helix domain-containing protein [Puia dinghuensis]|uniref:AraC family transcriptional regulator n=1 Tax=Puia dinghuensis TaxID=1792502 RepID=A0A8J2U6G8_9BACT|nr:helix-turn-helix domain-containing protein [Puia dinghuensis]GGA81508.1 AraC family transcriptional regulator [Puia dinghuensis]